MSNIDVDFKARNLQQRSYTTVEVLSTIRKVELIKKKKFVTATFDSNYKAFVIHVTALNISYDINNKVHPSQKLQIAYLKADEILIEVPSKYDDFTDTFLSKLAIELLKHISINNDIIKLMDD